MSPEVATFLFELVNFALLAVGLGWFFYRPVRKALDAEQQTHQDRVEEAARREAEVEKSEAELQDRLSRLDEELDGLRSEVLDSARERAAALLSEARQEIEARRRSAAEASRRRESGELVELTDLIAQTAGRSVEQLLLRANGPDLDEALTRVACHELAQLRLDPGERPAVTSASPLSDASRAALSEALATSFEEAVDPGLGCGLRVVTRAGLVDTTARSFASSAARAVLEAVGAEGG